MSSRVAADIAATRSGRVIAVVSRSGNGGGGAVEGDRQPRVYRTVTELLRHEAVDVAYVGSPNALHAGQAGQFVAAGCHVVCDKPIATSGDDALALAAAASAAGVRLTTNFQARHHPVGRWLRTEIESGSIGAVESVRVDLGLGFEALEGWRAVPRLAGAGAVFNLGQHAYDLVRFLSISDVETVDAVVEPAGRGALDRTAVAVCRLRSGALATMSVSQEYAVENIRMEVRGAAGVASWTGWLAPYRSGVASISTAAGTRRRTSSCPDAYARLVRAVADAIAAGTEPDPGSRDAVEAVRIAEAILRSGRERREVRIPALA